MKKLAVANQKEDGIEPEKRNSWYSFALTGDIPEAIMIPLITIKITAMAKKYKSVLIMIVIPKDN